MRNCSTQPTPGTNSSNNKLKPVDREDQHHQEFPGAWREDHHELEGINLSLGRNPSVQAKNQYNYLKSYYSSEVGSVSWQEWLVFPVGRSTQS